MFEFIVILLFVPLLQCNNPLPLLYEQVAHKESTMEIETIVPNQWAQISIQYKFIFGMFFPLPDN